MVGPNSQLSVFLILLYSTYIAQSKDVGANKVNCCCQLKTCTSIYYLYGVGKSFSLLPNFIIYECEWYITVCEKWRMGEREKKKALPSSFRLDGRDPPPSLPPAWHIDNIKKRVWQEKEKGRDPSVG